MKKGSINPHLWKARIGNCILCKKEFRAIKDFKKRKQKYCSKICWNKRNPPINNICKFCKIKFKTYPSQRKPYCLQKCRDLHYRERLKGSNSHFWEGGKTEASKLRRTCAEYKQWRMKVFIRDNFKCIWCSSKKKIEADHIKPQSKYPKMIYKLSNGRTLCRECHEKTDTYGSKSRRARKSSGK